MQDILDEFNFQNVCVDTSEKHGKHLKANRRFIPGEVIIEEHPLIVWKKPMDTENGMELDAEDLIDRFNSLSPDQKDFVLEDL